MKVFLFTLLFCPICLFAQNKLGNASFENKEDHNDCEAAKIPDDLGWAGCLDQWEDRNGGPNGPEPDNGTDYHSPDWYSNEWYINDYSYSQQHLALQERLDPNVNAWTPINPHTGTDFIGMRCCELTQQHLGNCSNLFGDPEDCLDPGEEYTVAMYIRTLGNSTAPSPISPLNYNDAYLNVYLATDKIRYLNDDDCEHETGINDWGQDIQLVASFKIDRTLYPYGDWHFISGSFIAPQDAYSASHNWFAIELEQNSGNCASYVLIDDISLMKCKPSCSRTAGEMWGIPVNNPHTENNPFGISNLYNVTNINFKVWNYLSQTLVKEYNFSSFNGFQESVYWNGKNESGAEVAAGLYEAEVTLTNDCGTKKQKFKFDKMNGIFTSTIPVNNTFDDPQVPVSINCCALEPDYYIDNTVLPGTAYIDYIASHGVYAATEPNSIVTVASNADVLFQGGYEVVMEPGFTVENGAEFIAQVLPCQISGKTDETANNNYYAPGDADDNVTPDEATPGPIEIRIIPNPNNGMFTIQTNTIDAKDILVQNLMGNTVYQSNNTIASNTEIDLRSFAVGVYIVKVQTQSGQVFVEKVVYR